MRGRQKLVGGQRQLGIPNVLDRVIQQAIHQVLTPLFDPEFSESSHGFRPERSAHGAATVADVRLVYQDRLVATHPRCWERERTLFEPIHYLALLERKPGGFDYARPLENWQLPDCYALLRRRLEAADPQQGTRSYIRVLRLLEKFTLPQLTAAIEYALDIDVIDSDSIRTVLEHRSTTSALTGPPQKTPMSASPASSTAPVHRLVRRIAYWA